jgi:hypothetical protein
MAFVDDADVQIHLPYDKLKIEAIPDDLIKAKADAERIVRGYLSGVIDSSVIALWTTPAGTPEIIRAITGRFAAALIYRLRFSEYGLTDPEYAQNKYNEAMSLLMKIIDGTITIPGTDPGTVFDNTYFQPNSTFADPVFAMGDQY